jgi:transketolase
LGEFNLNGDLSLDDVVLACRSNILDILEAGAIGHSGGSLSILETLVALYFEIAKINPKDPKWEDRDRIVLSKSHACEAMYAVLGEKGFFPKEKFKEFLHFNSMLQGHAEICTPGVEYSGGSLGQGISFACGLAYSARLKKKKHKVFCILGDGECHEGEVWEAAMFASHYKLDNLYVIVDYNHYCTLGDVDEIMNLKPLDDKWRSFGWETIYEKDGNNITKLINDFNELEKISGKPKCIIANTLKNNGVPIWEKEHIHHVSGKKLFDGLEEGRKLLK